MKKLKIGNKWVGDGEPLFITAEIGITCNYDVATSKKLIDVVKESGADAVKFIIWEPEAIMSDLGTVYTYQTTAGQKSVNMFEMLMKLRFTMPQWREVKDYAEKQGVIFFATTNSFESVRKLEEIGAAAYKLSSWDFNFYQLFELIAQKKKPMLIDTGPATLEEIVKIMDIIRREGNNEVILVHCYHTPNFHEMNMASIPYMRQTFDCLVGFSSTAQPSEQDIMAVALGACFIEKRLTLDKNHLEHHHFLSMEPEEFIEYVKMIRDVHAAVGKPGIFPSADDLETKQKHFRRMVAGRDLKAGTRISEDMIEFKRPMAGGLHPDHFASIVGRTLVKDVKYNQPFNWDLFDRG